MDSTQSVSSLPVSPGSTSSGFLERLKTQDAQAWRQLADVYGPLVYFWCRKYGVKSDDAADILQEVFASVAAAIGRFRRDEQQGRFRGWLWTITRRKIQDHYRNLEVREEARGGTQQWLAEVPEQPDERGSDDEERSQFSGLFVRVLETVKAEFEERTWQAFWQWWSKSGLPPRSPQDWGCPPTACGRPSPASCAGCGRSWGNWASRSICPKENSALRTEPNCCCHNKLQHAGCCGQVVLPKSCRAFPLFLVAAIAP